MSDDHPRPGDRIAKVIARAGLASRRDAEALVEGLRVRVNGRTVSNVATNVTERDRIEVDGAPLPCPEGARLWLYHKPVGLVTTERDEKGRETVFDALPPELGRVLSVGRLDLNSEGLLLLTNDGVLKRALELPSTGWLRRYRVRVNGTPAEGPLDRLRAGIEVDGPEGREVFAPMQVTLDRQQGANAWLTIGLREGRNREVRRALVAVDLYVNRLIRVSYGPFQLGTLAAGAVEEVRPRVLAEQLGGIFDGALARGRQGGQMAADDEGEDARAGRDGAGKAKGRKPRPSGDRLVEHGRGGSGKPAPRAKGGAGGKRADPAEGRAERAARPDRPRTAKALVTRNDGDGSRPDRPRRDLEGRHRGDGPRKPAAAAGDARKADRTGPRRAEGDRAPGPTGDRKPRPKDGTRSAGGAHPAGGERSRHQAGDRKPRAKDGPRPARPSGSGKAPPPRGERPPRTRDGERSGGERKRWAKDGPRPARRPGGTDAPPRAGDVERPARPAADRKPWKKDGPRPGGDRRPRSEDAGARPPRGDRPARDGARGTAGPGEPPRETKADRTARLRADTSVSLRKGGQRGRGVAKAKPAPSTKRMRKPEEDGDA